MGLDVEKSQFENSEKPNRASPDDDRIRLDRCSAIHPEILLPRNTQMSLWPTGIPVANSHD